MPGFKIVSMVPYGKHASREPGGKAVSGGQGAKCQNCVRVTDDKTVILPPFGRHSFATFIF